MNYKRSTTRLNFECWTILIGSPPRYSQHMVWKPFVCMVPLPVQISLFRQFRHQSSSSGDICDL